MTIAITGAGGFLGQSLINKIVQQTSWNVIAFTSSFGGGNDTARLIYYNNDRLEEVLRDNDIDIILHLAFSRRFRSSTEIAMSIDFSYRVYKSALNNKCRVVNLSTVGIYGQNETFLSEKDLPAPDSLYSMAKYASEGLLESVFSGQEERVTNLRLSGIAQSQRVLPIFIEQAKTVGKINIQGGTQQFSWIDIDDATEAIIALFRYTGEWKPIYNVTLNRYRYSIVEVANIVAEVAKEKGYKSTEISVTPSDMTVYVGWNSDLFMQDTGWYPRVTLKETIRKMF